MESKVHFLPQTQLLNSRESIVAIIWGIKVHSLPLTQLLNPKERSICGIKSSFSTFKILLSPKEGSQKFILYLKYNYSTLEGSLTITWGIKIQSILLTQLLNPRRNFEKNIIMNTTADNT